MSDRSTEQDPVDDLRRQPAHLRRSGQGRRARPDQDLIARNQPESEVNGLARIEAEARADVSWYHHTINPAAQALVSEGSVDPGMVIGPKAGGPGQDEIAVLRATEKLMRATSGIVMKVRPEIAQEWSQRLGQIQRDLSLVDQPRAASMRATPVGDTNTSVPYVAADRPPTVHSTPIAQATNNWGDIIATGNYGDVFLGTAVAETLLGEKSHRKADDNGRYLRIWDPAKGKVLSDSEMTAYLAAFDNPESNMSGWHDRPEGKKLRVVMQTGTHLIDMFTNPVTGATALIEQITRALYSHGRNTPAKFAKRWAGADPKKGNSLASEQNYAVVLLEALNPEFERQPSDAEGRKAVTYKDAEGNEVDAGYSEADYQAAEAFVIEREGKSAPIIALYFAIARHEGSKGTLGPEDLIRAVDASKMATGKTGRMDTHGLKDWDTYQETLRNEAT